MVALDSGRSLIVHVVPAPFGGGAEHLAKELSEIKTSRINSKAIYFSYPHAMKVSSKDYYLGISLRNPTAIFRIRHILKRELKSYGEIIVHAHLTWPLFFCRLAALWLPVILIYTEHSTYNKRRRFRFLKWLDRWFYRGYRQIICISSAVQDALQRWLGSTHQLVVINNGAVLGEYCPASCRPEEVHLISVGRLVSAKGFDVTIRAVSELKNEIASYLIWGDGPCRSELQALIDRANAGDFIRLMGWSDNIPQKLSKASILLVPSRWEGFGLVAVEGMSTGLPVLASAVPGLSEIVGKGVGRVVVQNFNSPAAWKEAIRAMKSVMQQKKDEVSLDVRSRSEMFSIEKMKTSHISFYEDLFDSNFKRGELEV